MNHDVEILNTGLAHEQLAIAAYEVGASSGLLSDGVIQVAKTFQAHHGQHAAKLRDTIISLHGKPVQPLPKEEQLKKMPVNELTNQEEIIRYALKLEKQATITYLNAISAFKNSKITQAAASILGDEAMHWAALRNALGLPLVHISFIPLSESEVED